METADSLTTPSVAENRCQQLSDKNQMINRDEILSHLPPGVRFVPNSGALFVDYLIPKANNQELPPNKFNEVEFYRFDPDELAETYKADIFKRNGIYEWYFFSVIEKCGRRNMVNRVAGNGLWVAIGPHKRIKDKGEEVGFCQTLAYYRERTKTHWRAQEFRLKDPPAPVPTTNQNNMKFNEWVIYKLFKIIRGSSRYKKIVKGSSSRTTANTVEMDDQIDPLPNPDPLSPIQGQDNDSSSVFDALPESSRTTANTVEMDDQIDPLPNPAPLSPIQGQDNDFSSVYDRNHFQQGNCVGSESDYPQNEQELPGTSFAGTNQF